MAIYYTFSERKHACLFTTNLGARGLDFPAIDWVVMLDCPDNVESYVHKIGRTARFTHSGKSLIFVAKSEQKFIDNLKEKKIVIHKLTPNPERQLTIKKTLLALCSEDNDLKYLA
jgi:ATP-dependent RNA helicase DDX10/DBP4